MTTSNLLFLSALQEQEAEAERAVELLQHAVSELTSATPAEQPADKAHRLRGAAVLVGQAVNEILITVGFLEAASVSEGE